MTPVEQAFVDHRRLLWGLAYQMLGTTSDADEVVQDAFVRALVASPASDRPLRPWLVRVTLNAARDRLRRRKSSPYDGPWLPEPLAESGSDVPLRQREPVVDPELPGERLEAVSYALLVALERLTPGQRAVWLLREVMGLSTAEAAQILEQRDGSVKTTLHRARKALDGEVLANSALQPGLAAVGALAAGILAGDVAAVVRLLAEDAVALTDGGGVYHAARRPVVGALDVARLLVGLARKTPRAAYEPAVIAGCPAVVLRIDTSKPRFAPVVVTLFGVRDGRVERVWSLSAPAKLDL